MYVPCLESLLCDGCSLQDFLEAGFSAEVYPKIYRELPAQNGNVKESFSDLACLKLHWIDKAILSLYENVRVPHLSIVIFTWVMPPGLGDWIAQQEIAALIKKRYPFLQVHLVTLFHRSVQELPLCDFPSFTFSYEENLHCDFFPSEVWQLFRSAALILQLPTYYPFTDLLLEKIRKNHPKFPHYELIGEYGFIDSPHFHPKTGARCMGLHFLEKGVIIKEGEKPFTEFSFKNKTLEHFFLEGKENRSRFYLAYLLTDRGMTIYFEAILLAFAQDCRDIDFCFTDIGFFLRKKETLTPFLKNQGVREVVFYLHSECFSLAIQENGKRMRLLHLPSLSSSDFQQLMHLSDEPIGCRGDQSFSLSVSLEKAFFYDPPQHARAFLHDLIALAERRICEYPATIALFKLCLKILGPVEEEQLACEMARLLADRELLFGFKKVNAIIRKEHAVNLPLLNLVARALTHFHKPALAIKEGEVIQHFLDGKISLKECARSIKASIASL
jgi:hypothetical protein